MIQVGDRVICIDANDNPSFDSYGLIHKREYIVYSKQTCECGEVFLDVGLTSTNPNPDFCSKCLTVLHETNTVLVEQWRFRKVEEKINYVKVEIKVEEPCLN